VTGFGEGGGRWGVGGRPQIWLGTKLEPNLKFRGGEGAVLRGEGTGDMTGRYDQGDELSCKATPGDPGDCRM